MAYRLNEDVRCSARSPATVPREVAAIWKGAAEAATRAPGDIWRALFDLPLTDGARAIFEEARDLFDWDFVLPPAVMFHPHRLPIECSFAAPSGRVTLAIETAEQAKSLQAVLAGQRHACNSAGEDGAEAIAADLTAAGLLTEERLRPPQFAKPGIYRSLNSAVVFRSEQACVVVDPDFFYGRWLGANDMATLDAVVISHSHMDHFSYLALLQFPRDTTIIVPHVEKQSILSEDMAGLLRDAGFTNVIVAPWHTSHRVKDIVIHALPFYGEQPWLSFASPVFALRNWGNTYVIETPTARTWLLVDSGSEYGYSMLEVADEVAQLGGVDVFMSGVFDVRWHPGQIDGWGGQWWCFPVEKLNTPQSWPTGQLMNLGHANVNRLLATVKARHFFPYTSPRYLAGTAAESDQVAKIAAIGPLATEFHSWQIGDRVEFGNGPCDGR